MLGFMQPSFYKRGVNTSPGGWIRNWCTRRIQSGDLHLSYCRNTGVVAISWKFDRFTVAVSVSMSISDIKPA